MNDINDSHNVLIIEGVSVKEHTLFLDLNLCNCQVNHVPRQSCNFRQGRIMRRIWTEDVIDGIPSTFPGTRPLFLRETSDARGLGYVGYDSVMFCGNGRRE